ncbi:hypothetical protein Cni_G09964 [Canna indica]|uniref:Uncharacterized protein n=1 Tax=Canna indica TaxID=4628 RepID=A0AAQ3K3G0_9LILI|nr:hypothetical protein Cni_G09964 [Canna indica]
MREEVVVTTTSSLRGASEGLSPCPTFVYVSIGRDGDVVSIVRKHGVVNVVDLKAGIDACGSSSSRSLSQGASSIEVKDMIQFIRLMNMK